MNTFLFCSLYYKKNLVTGANKRFENFIFYFQNFLSQDEKILVIVKKGNIPKKIKRTDKISFIEIPSFFILDRLISYIYLSIKFYRSKKMVTITAVNPPARFGELKIRKSKVFKFSEKKSIIDSWINGGFFVVNKEFLKFIKNDQSILESEPLEKISKIGELIAYKHFKFWQCMDTKRDRDKLNYLLKTNQAPWLS